MDIEQLNNEILRFANVIVDTVNIGIQKNIPLSTIIGVLEQVKTDLIFRKIQAIELKDQSGKEETGTGRGLKIINLNDS